MRTWFAAAAVGLVGSAAGATVGPGSAWAFGSDAIAKVVGDTIVYDAGTAQDNKVAISRTVAAPFLFIEFDDVYPILPGSGECWRPYSSDPTRVACLTAKTSLLVRTYDGNDTVVNTTTYGGQFLTGDGNDYLDSSASTAPVTGDLGLGSDTVLPGLASDSIQGGGPTPAAATDIVSYAGRTGPMRINADFLFGYASQLRVPFGEYDSLPGFEGAIGGAGPDVIDGMTLYYAHGVGGDDHITCSTDLYPFVVVQITGGDGDDTLDTKDNCYAALFMFGGAGDDVVSGAGATDPSYLSGGPGMDVVHGGHSDDVLIGGSGFDSLNGGYGVDDCDVDQFELSVNCETLS
jgi:Ca2+-binding RTX toxin-like protein